MEITLFFKFPRPTLKVQVWEWNHTHPPNTPSPTVSVDISLVRTNYCSYFARLETPEKAKREKHPIAWLIYIIILTNRAYEFFSGSYNHLKSFFNDCISNLEYMHPEKTTTEVGPVFLRSHWLPQSPLWCIQTLPLRFIRANGQITQWPTEEERQHQQQYLFCSITKIILINIWIKIHYIGA